MPTSAIHSAQRFGLPILCNSGNSTTSAGALMARLAFNFGLQTATMSSSIRYCEIVPGQCDAPWNTAASNGSSAESIGACRAVIWTMIFGFTRWKFGRRGTSQRAANVGSATRFKVVLLENDATRCVASARSSNAFFTCDRYILPASVNTTRWRMRSNRRMPRWISSSRICRLIAPWVKLSSPAARVKLPC